LSSKEYISFRCSEKDLTVLEALMQTWEENQTQVIKRALQLAYDVECQLHNDNQDPERSRDE